MTDADVNLSYNLWDLKGITPSQFDNIKSGEKLILRAFVSKYIEDEEERIKEMNRGGR